MEQNTQGARPAAFDASIPKNSGMDMWGFLRRRKGFIILFALLGTGLAYFNFQRKTERYSSTALVQVIHHNSDPRLESLLAERNLADAKYVLTSRKLLDPCYEKHALGELGTLRGLPLEAATKRIAGMISAKSQTSNIMRLSCEGGNPVDTAKIVNAVAEEFIFHHQDSYETAVTKLQSLLSQASDQIHTQLMEVEQQYREFDEKSPLRSDGKNPHTQDHAQLESNIFRLVVEQSKLKSELQGLEAAMQRGEKRTALLLLIGKESDSSATQAQANRSAQGIVTVPRSVTLAQQMKQAMFPLMMEEVMLKKELGAGHPKLEALREKIRFTQQHYQTLAGMQPQRPKATTKTPVVDEVPTEDFLTVYVDSLKEQLAILERTAENLETMSAAKEKAAKSLRSFEHKRIDFERQIARLTSLFEDVQQQIRDTELPTNQLGGVTATILDRGMHGGLVYPKLSQFLTYGAMLGGLLGLALGYAVEAADRSFRKPEEIIREFGIPILAHIPFIRDKKLAAVAADRAMDATVIARHLPRSRPSEAYRTARTALCFSAQSGSHRLIQVTSPAAGDGKSTLAINLAVCLAQSGKNTLIMESDFRRPKVHKLTGVDNEIGVVDYLRGKAELVDVIVNSEVNNLSVLPCGSRPQNPSELLTQPEYEELLNVLREKFDYVIIDTPPVLVVNDPCSVAPRADAVLLCVRLSRQTRDFGTKALEQLYDVGGTIAGVVINGVEETDAYGYGNYRYSDYRYNYKEYGYGAYRYGRKNDEAYFADEDDDATNSDEFMEDKRVNGAATATLEAPVKSRAKRLSPKRDADSDDTN